MKKLKIVENPKMDFHPEHKMSADEMGFAKGGAGCICDKNPFNVNDGCLCNDNKFGICSGVNGGGSGPGNGCKTNYSVIPCWIF